jgi:hypothetical protein
MNQASKGKKSIDELIADRGRDYDRILANDPLAKLPLRWMICRDPEGKPLKTEIAKALPLHSRSDRRKIMRQLLKDEKRAQKCRTSSQSAAASSTA